MAAVRFPAPKAQFFKSDGTFAENYVLYVYLATTTTPATVYSDADDTIATNPYTLDARGEADVWLDPSSSYKFVLKTAVGGSTIWTVDEVSADITPAEGTFAVSATGPFAAESVSVRYRRQGKMVALQFPSMIKAGNSTAAVISLDMTNMAASLRPAIQMFVPTAIVRDNGSDQNTPGVLLATTSGAFQIYLNAGDSTFTGSTNDTGWSAFTAMYLTS